MILTKNVCRSFALIPILGIIGGCRGEALATTIYESQPKFILANASPYPHCQATTIYESQPKFILANASPYLDFM